MSLLGIGSAKINLVLEKGEYEPGECVTGYFVINGGNTEKKLKRIECDLISVNKSDAQESIVETSTILTSKLLKCDEISKIPFKFHLPESLPASALQMSYKFKTNLIFNEGAKSIDLDEIKVLGVR
jgi:sporulation-control protein